MNEFFDKVALSVTHLKALHSFFNNPENYIIPSEQNDLDIYHNNLNGLINSFSEIDAFGQLYNKKGRQHILADLFEYILLGRAYYSMGTAKRRIDKKQHFIKGILHLVNLLMCFETITVNVERRNRFLDHLSALVEEISNEDEFNSLRGYAGEVGLPSSEEGKTIGRYFDKLLPKTAGGLWHELLVYAFILRNDLGYVLPVLLHQKIYSKNDHIVPPDFLLITKDKRIYGIEVGIKKEIQSGSFSLKTAIPTATIDTINSRNSDRCPICKKWINLCPYVIDNYSNFDTIIERIEVKCLENCNHFTREQILNGDCNYCKYSRGRAQSLAHTHHSYADHKHYHYNCVLENITAEKRIEVIAAEDNNAIKTHYPYYSGLEDLF
ncbi:MAG: hypothetical protein JW723_07065 [Bacteroidales bacterium]|nr:hypothetical protein [Bacteroidales bacterium]